MAIREIRIDPGALLLILAGTWGEPPLPLDAKVTDVALDHGHSGTHRLTPPTIVLQITSGEFSPEDAGRPLLPMSFRR